MSIIGNIEHTIRDVYNRIYNYKEYEGASRGIWAQAQGSLIETNSDIESPFKFKTDNCSVVAGFDTMASSDVAIGIFVKSNKTNKTKISQNVHSAEVNSYGLGVYGGLVKEKFDIKAILSGSVDNYETTRNVRFANNKSDGKFDEMTCSFDVEAGYRIPLTDDGLFGKMKLRPYAGAAAALINTKAFKETGAYIGAWI